ncbi:site-specific integrase [Cohaesibacter haloalkalitolerans]|uniref:site-specific integrase n=1 Tax=Cohaesibacter haloalkalitolerans TaxID=1162980 RepID=UPI000E653F9D|nr:site-specific integrase [Cohaesibacter haloalkalitolerans]
MAFLVMPHRATCEKCGRPSLAHIPILFTFKWKLLHEAYEYLVARGAGRWSADKGAASAYSGYKKPSENSMKAYGRDLEHFYTYCERYRLDWKTVSYIQLLETYQTAMQFGKCTADGNPLSASTINRRMGTVGDFLTFAAYHGMRDPFEISQDSLPAHIHYQNQARTGKPTTTQSRRVGRVRQDPEDLRLPTRPEIVTWLESIHAEHPGDHGNTGYLMCRTVIETGMRSEEVRLIRARQIPNLRDPEQVAGDVTEVGVKIYYGTKGDRMIGDPEKKGKPRKISIDRNLLFRLDAYIRGPRKRAIEVFKARNEGKSLPKELFLSPSTGRPYSHRRFLEIWAQEKSKNRRETMPFPGWSIHLGRHAWACYEVLRRIDAELVLIKEEVRFAGSDNHIPSSTTVNGMARDLIEQIIRPAMGHVSSETTERYLRWLRSQLGRNKYSRDWSNWLDGEIS